jgi:hypothetical protein
MRISLCETGSGCLLLLQVQDTYIPVKHAHFAFLKELFAYN